MAIVVLRSSSVSCAAWQRGLAAVTVARVEDPAATAVFAAGLYARCRWVGITPRSANDCLIAMSCIELAQPLLHRDDDFVRMAGIEPRLRLMPTGTRRR